MSTCKFAAVLKFENVEDLNPTQWFFWWIFKYFCFTKFPHFGQSNFISLEDFIFCWSGQWCEDKYFTTWNERIRNVRKRVKRKQMGSINDNSDSTIVHSKTRRSWFYILIGYNSLTNDTIRKSMGCFEKFRKFPIWWTPRFSNLVKGELRKWSLKILTWFLKVCFLSHITALLIFLGE